MDGAARWGRVLVSVADWPSWDPLPPRLEVYRRLVGGEGTGAQTPRPILALYGADGSRRDEGPELAAGLLEHARVSGRPQPVRLRFRGEELRGEVRPLKDGFQLVAIPGPDFLQRLLAATQLLAPAAFLYVAGWLVVAWRLADERTPAAPARAPRKPDVPGPAGRPLRALGDGAARGPDVLSPVVDRDALPPRDDRPRADRARDRAARAGRLPALGCRGARPPGAARRHAALVAGQCSRVRPGGLFAGGQARGHVAPRSVRGRPPARTGPGGHLRGDRPGRGARARRHAADRGQPLRGDHDGAVLGSRRAGRPQPRACSRSCCCRSSASPRPRRAS